MGVRRAGTDTRGRLGEAEGVADGLRVANEGEAAGGWWTAGAGGALLEGASGVGVGAGVLGVGGAVGDGVGGGGVVGGGGGWGTHQQ